MLNIYLATYKKHLYFANKDVLWDLLIVDYDVILIIHQSIVYPYIYVILGADSTYLSFDAFGKIAKAFWLLKILKIVNIISSFLTICWSGAGRRAHLRVLFHIFRSYD